MPVTDAHIHVQPWWELRAEVLEVMTRGRTDVPELQSIMKSPERLLRRLDQDGIARAVLVNYPSPDLMGFTARVNEYVAEYCKAAPDRLVPMGGVHGQDGGHGRVPRRRGLARDHRGPARPGKGPLSRGEEERRDQREHHEPRLARARRPPRVAVLSSPPPCR